MPWKLPILVLLLGPTLACAQERIVFMGDSITDGHTCPLLVRQALADAGRAVPTCINAGVASDTAKLMRARLERDVLSRRPTLVTLSVGINDVLHNVPLGDFESDVSAIADKLQMQKIPLIILTTSILGPKHKAADDKLADYNAVLRRIAEKHGLKIADVNGLMQNQRRARTEMLEADQVHLSYEGYRTMARAVLDALGYRDVAVPRELKLELLPGVVRRWQMRPVGEKEPALNADSVAGLKPDASWKTIEVPDAETQSHWWQDHERRRGFVLGLSKRLGPARQYVAMATIEAKEPRKVFFNTGAQIQSIWLNGKQIFRNEGWTGWHAGKERIPAELRAGRNDVVIETGGDFFLSVTDTEE